MLRLLTRSSFLFLRDAGSSRSRVQLLVRPARRRNIHRPGAIALPTPPPLSNLATSHSKDADDAARDWLIRFKGSPIPRTAVDIAFSRSSGPGGQVCLHSSFYIRIASIEHLRWRTERQQSKYKGNSAMCLGLALDTPMGS